MKHQLTEQERIWLDEWFLVRLRGMSVVALCRAEARAVRAGDRRRAERIRQEIAERVIEGGQQDGRT